MLLAEANQWPEDAVAYMGDGDMSQMAFHFPLMPRMFMAARQEDRFPMVDILSEIPSTPSECQWALFLRNHDELTLEMVTDEERDYMYRVYAQDQQARVNVGIRRRLAPLLGNDRKLIEMMNGLLFSMPGTPIIYYGDEIGMGDNIYLGDRNGVRTPMQWSGDRNAGFSDANPQRLFLPVIIDSEYHSQAINVEAQLQNSNSLLWWMKRLIALRQRYQAFGRGTLEILFRTTARCSPSFAIMRTSASCASSISPVTCSPRSSTCPSFGAPSRWSCRATRSFRRSVTFPTSSRWARTGSIGSPWSANRLICAKCVRRSPSPVAGTPCSQAPPNADSRPGFPSSLSQRRWFAQKSRAITSASVLDAVAVPDAPASRNGNGGTQAPSLACVLIVQLELDHGSPERYLLPLAHLSGLEAEEIKKWHPEAVVADDSPFEDSTLVDAVHTPAFVRAMADLLTRRRTLNGSHGQLVGLPTPSLRRFDSCHRPDCPTTPLSAEQSNSSVMLGDAAIMKFIRRVEDGVNPGVEIGRFLSERARLPHVPRLGGSIEYRARGIGGQPATVAVLEEFVPNEDDGWEYVVDALSHGLEDALTNGRLGPARLRRAGSCRRRNETAQRIRSWARTWNGRPCWASARPNCILP